MMRKFNADSHYNHMLNQYANALVIEINNLMSKHTAGGEEHAVAAVNHTLSVGAQKFSVDDKAAWYPLW